MTAAANFGLMYRGRYYYILAGDYDDGELRAALVHGAVAAPGNDALRHRARLSSCFRFHHRRRAGYKREWCDIELSASATACRANDVAQLAGLAP